MSKKRYCGGLDGVDAEDARNGRDYYVPIIRDEDGSERISTADIGESEDEARENAWFHASSRGEKVNVVNMAVVNFVIKAILILILVGGIALTIDFLGM